MTICINNFNLVNSTTKLFDSYLVVAQQIDGLRKSTSSLAVYKCIDSVRRKPLSVTNLGEQQPSNSPHWMPVLGLLIRDQSYQIIVEIRWMNGSRNNSDDVCVPAQKTW